MGQVAALNRRQALALTAGAAAAGVAGLAGCQAEPPAQWPGGWVGAGAQRGHRLRPQAAASPLPAPANERLRTAHTLVLGGGIAGLAAARTFARRGVDDVHLLELEDEPGGNSRGMQLAGMACPLGAHYLPLPGPHAHEVQQLLFDLKLARTEFGRTVYAEEHLCHSPQERLFFEGAWHEGLLPPAEPGSALQAQYQRFGQRVEQLQRELGFALPSQRLALKPGHLALDAQPFAAWLQAEGITHAHLLSYLDYCCRDDYGAGTDTVSAWAGLHYFASRHGFHAEEGDAPREGVLTWPEGNAFLTRALATPLAPRIHTHRTVMRVREERAGVTVWALDETGQQWERWQAQQVVIALPLFIALRVLEQPPQALREATATLRYAPWLVANLHFAEPLLDRVGAAPAWDNVRHGSPTLGYVDAMHQRFRPHSGPTVLTSYWALPQAQRAALLNEPWQAWAQRVVIELAQTHPDAPHKLSEIRLMRYGHAMSIPVPGVRSSAALAALRAQRGRVRFAHADLAGYSVFEEAYTLGCLAAQG
jgi:monoamine oxidase